MVNVIKGVGVHPPPSPASADFTFITECTPESSSCNSVYSVSPHSSYCKVNSPVASALQLLRRELLHDLKDGRLEDSLLVLEEGAVYRHLVGQHWIPHTCTRNTELFKYASKCRLFIKLFTSPVAGVLDEPY
jgi:hypothetical protein